jgi:translocation and assembly module TamA
VPLEPKRRRKTALFLAGLWFLASNLARADEQQPIVLCVEGVQGAQRANVLAYLQIAQGRATEPDESIVASVTGTIKKVVEVALPPSCYKAEVSGSRLRWLHNKAEDDIRQALKPFGYYQPSVESTLEQTKEGWRAHYRIDVGPPIRIARLDVRVLGEGEQDPKFQEILADLPLAQREILSQPAYQDLKEKLERTATNRGYFDARFEKHQIGIDLHANTADVILWFDTGKRYYFGQIHLPETALALGFLRRYVEFQPGDPYESSKLVTLQSDLINSDYFKRVEVNAAQDQASDYHIPVNVELEPQGRSNIVLGAGYATDTGPRGRLGWKYRWVNPYGHRLNMELRASAIKYGVASAYEIPGADPSRDLYSLNARLSREDSDVKDTTMGVLGASWSKYFGFWQRLLSLKYGLERFRTEDTQTSKLLIPGISLIRVAKDDPLAVTHGSRFEFKLQGAYEPLLSDVSFVQPKVSGKLVWSFAKRNRLTARADLGTTWVSDFDKLPSSLRFYAGGDQSVRGYDLDKISPVNDDGDEVGGKHLVVGSLEYEYRLFEQWGIAAFVDSGDAFDNGLDMKTGVGIGIHWYSPIGPVRVDVAHGLDRPPGDTIRLHLIIGPVL